MLLRRHPDKQKGSNIAKTSHQILFLTTTSVILPFQFWITSGNELDTCFDADGSQNLLEFVKLLPVEVVKTTSHLRPEYFSSLIQVYDSDLRFVKSIDVELDLWQDKWTGNFEHAQALNTLGKVLAYTDYDYSPNVHTLLEIMATFTCHKLRV